MIGQLLDPGQLFRMNKKALYGGLGVGALGIAALIILLVVNLNTEPESSLQDGSNSYPHPKEEKEKNLIKEVAVGEDMGPGKWALDKNFSISLYEKFNPNIPVKKTYSGYETNNSEAITKAVQKEDLAEIYAEPSLQKFTEISGRILSTLSENKMITKMEVEVNLISKLVEQLITDLYKGRIGRESLEKKAKAFKEIGVSTLVFFGGLDDILGVVEKFYFFLLSGSEDEQPEERDYFYNVKKNKYYVQFQSFLKEFKKIADPQEIDIVTALSEISMKFIMSKKSAVFVAELEVRYIYLPRYLAALSKVPKDYSHPAFKAGLFPLINRVSVLFQENRWKYLAGMLAHLKEKQEIAVFWIGLDERLKSDLNSNVFENANTIIVEFMKTGKIPESVFTTAKKYSEKDPLLKLVISQHLTQMNSS